MRCVSTTALALLALLTACRTPESPPASTTAADGSTTFGGDAMAANNPVGGAPTGAGDAARPEPTSTLPPGEGPTFPLTMPQDLSLWCTEERGGTFEKESVEEVFVSRGTKFRLEQLDAKRGAVALLYDGTQIAAMSKAGSKAAPRAEDVDLRVRYARLYAEDLPRTNVVGKEDVEGHTCWHFSSSGAGQQENLSQGSFDLWVETKTQLPRKLATTLPDGGTITLTCRDLPATITVADADFDGASLQAKFVQQLPKR